MSGLIRKDIYLLKDMGKILLLMLALEIFLVLQSGAIDFALGYMTVFAAMFVMNTIAYDEPGFGFLMTLPVSRKQYVAGKYVFGICSGILFEVVSLGIVAAAGRILPNLQTEWRMLLLKAIIYLGLTVIFQSFMMPLWLKFGAEKARNIILLGVITIFLAGMRLVEILLPPEENLPEIMEWITMHPGMTAGIGICFVLLLLAGSIWLSIRIIRRKEF